VQTSEAMELVLRVDPRPTAIKHLLFDRKRLWCTHSTGSCDNDVATNRTTCNRRYNVRLSPIRDSKWRTVILTGSGFGPSQGQSSVTLGS
jgi:hypothetical protein